MNERFERMLYQWRDFLLFNFFWSLIPVVIISVFYFLGTTILIDMIVLFIVSAIDFGITSILLIFIMYQIIRDRREEQQKEPFLKEVMI